MIVLVSARRLTRAHTVKKRWRVCDAEYRRVLVNDMVEAKTADTTLRSRIAIIFKADFNAHCTLFGKRKRLLSLTR